MPTIFDEEDTVYKAPDWTPEAPSMFRPDGQLTPSGSMTVDSPLADDLGWTSPRADGVLTELAQGGISAGKQVKRRFGSTFGLERTVNNVDYWMKNNPEFGSPTTESFWDPASLAYTAGHATGTSAPLIGIGTAAGFASGGNPVVGFGAAMSVAFAQEMGETYEMLETAAPDMDAYERLGLAISGSLLKAGIEAGFGAEAVASRSFGKALAIQGLKGVGSKEFMRNIGLHAVYRYSGGFKSWLRAGLGEGLEEPQQRLVDDLLLNISSGKPLSEVSDYVSDFMHGTVGGLFLGFPAGIAELSSRSAINKIGNELTEDTVRKVHSDRSGQFDVFSKQQTDLLFDGLAKEMLQTGRFSEDGVASLTKTMKTAAYNIAAEAGVMPQDLINTFKVAFPVEVLTEEDMNILRTLKDSQSESLDYLDRKFGVRDMMTSTLDNLVSQTVERYTSSLKESNPNTPTTTDQANIYWHEISQIVEKQAEIRSIQQTELTQQAEDFTAQFKEANPEATDEQVLEAAPDELKTAIEGIEPQERILISSPEGIGVVTLEETYVNGAPQEDGSVVKANRNGALIQTLKDAGGITAEARRETPTTSLVKTEPVTKANAQDVADFNSALARVNLLEQYGNDQRREEVKQLRSFTSPANLNLTDAPAVQFQEGGGLHGQYFSDHNLAVFYSTADEGTVIHEWFHHIMAQGLLPTRYRDALAKQYTRDGDWNEAGLENAANAVIVYLRDNEIEQGGDAESRAALEYIRGVFSEQYKHVKELIEEENLTEGSDLNLKDKTKEAFDSMFAITVPSETQVIYGRALNAATFLGQLANAAPELLIGHDAVAGSITDGKVLFQLTKRKNSLNTKLHGLYKSHDAVKAASEKFLGKPYSPADISVADLEMLSSLANESTVRGWRENPASAREALKAQFNVQDENAMPTEVKNAFVAESKWLERSPLVTAEDRAATPESIASSLVDHVNRLPDAEDLRAKRGNGPVPIQKIRARFKKAFKAPSRMFTNWSHLMNYLDGNSFEGAFYENMGRPIRAGQIATAELQGKDIDFFDKAVAAAGIENYGNLINQEIDLGKQKFIYSTGEAITMHMMGRDKVQREALKQSNNISEDVLKDATKFVKSSKEAQALVAMTDTFFEGKFIVASPIYNEQTGTKLGKIKGYVPQVRESGAFADHDQLISIISSSVGMSAAQYQEAQQKWAQSRNLIRGGKIRVVDPIKMAGAYARDVNNYVSKVEMISKLLKAIDQESFQTAVDAKYGEDFPVWKTLKELLEREMYASGRMHPVTDIESIISDLGSNARAAFLGFRITTMPKQAVSLPMSLAIIPGGAANIPRATAIGLDLSQKMLTNSSRGGITATELLADTDVLPLYKKWAPHLLLRGGGSDVQEAGRGNAKGLGALKIGGRTIQQRSLQGMTEVDTWTVAVSWMTAFRSMRDTLSRTLGDTSEAERRAAEFANRVIEDTHPATLMHEKNLWQTGSKFQTELTPFSSQLLNNFQEYQTKVLLPLSEAIRSGKPGEFYKTLFKANGTMDTSVGQKAMFGAALPALLMGILVRRRLPREKEWMTDLIAYPLTTVPIVGPALTQWLMYKWNDPQITPLYLELPTQAFKAMSAIADGEVDFGGREGADILRAFALWQGFPDVLLQFTREAGARIIDGVKVEDITADEWLKIIQARRMPEPQDK